jgi:hypothetical protein
MSVKEPSIIRETALTEQDIMNIIPDSPDESVYDENPIEYDYQPTVYENQLPVYGENPPPVYGENPPSYRSNDISFEKNDDLSYRD